MGGPHLSRDHAERRPLPVSVMPRHDWEQRFLLDVALLLLAALDRINMREVGMELVAHQMRCACASWWRRTIRGCLLSAPRRSTKQHRADAGRPKRADGGLTNVKGGARRAVPPQLRVSGGVER